MERLSLGKVVEHYVAELEDVEYYIADEVDKQIKELTELIDRIDNKYYYAMDYEDLVLIGDVLEKVRG